MDDDDIDQEKIEEIKKQLNKEDLLKDLEDLNLHPLFCTDQEILNNPDNPDMEALRQILYDDKSPEETA